MYFHTDDSDVKTTLAWVVTEADARDMRLRFNVDSDGTLTYKIGEGMWSAPIASTPDPYRDGPSLGQAQHEGHDLSKFEGQ